MDRFTDTEKNNFYRAADSLRKYRRAELVDETTGESILNELYCDPLPAHGLSNRINSANTTLIVGRKGTGKSTVFQKLQHDVRRSGDRLTAYIDIKTIWDSSQVDIGLQERIALIDFALPATAVRRMLMYRTFLMNVVEEIKKELDKKLAESRWERIKNAFSGKVDTLRAALDSFQESYSDDNFVRVLGIKTVGLKESANLKQATEASVKHIGELGLAKAKATSEGRISAKDEHALSRDENFSDVLINVFDPAALIAKLKGVLRRSEIRHLFLLIDDFSELPEDAMQVVVDVLLAPMNNLSDEFIKLKIAAYPGRIYLGSIDRTKIDEVYLDLFKLYGSGDISKLEDSGIDFTRRLITQRIENFCGGNSSRFFDRYPHEVFKQLFNAGLCNPRILGHILVYLHESHITADKPIGVKAIGDAARKFYEEKVESFFQSGRFLQEAFNERSSIFSLKELLESFVQRAREARRHSSTVFSKIGSTPPTSHFHVPTQYESLLTTLELNFFLTKYFEMSDREGRKVAVYAMNFGLCDKYSITFGRPVGEREFRLYFVERVFDYSPLILNYLKSNQEIVCCGCGHKFEHADLEKLQFYGMKCNKCETGKCRVTNLSRKYEEELRSVSNEILLPRTELGILQTLQSADEPMRAKEIAEELDCSHQLIGWGAKHLEERKLVSRDTGDDKRRSYSLTPLARQSYFDASLKCDLHLE